VPRRAVLLLLDRPPATAGCPPGVDPAAFARALSEDVADLISDLPGIEPAIGYSADRRPDAAAVSWPTTLLAELPPPGGALAGLAALATHGYGHGAAVAPDAPDLPALVIAKPFSGLATATVAAAPATGGGLVVLASRLPVPPWLAESGIDVDTQDAVERLRLAAPHRSDLVVTPPWRRLRDPADIAFLDSDLEGWEATRALLSGRRG
jgi:hypothetical protein